MKNKTINIFKIEYCWYEGDYDITLLGKDVEQKEFEKDLVKAKKFAEGLMGKETKDYNYLDKGYRVECLPEYYDRIVWFLTNKLGYIVCYMNDDLSYTVSEEEKIEVRRVKREFKREDLK